MVPTHKLSSPDPVPKPLSHASFLLRIYIHIHFSFWFVSSWITNGFLTFFFFFAFVKTDPKRLKKELPKALKTIKPEDRLLLIGTSRCPFEAEMKPLISCYQRTILIPRPDYASRHREWALSECCFFECVINQPVLLFTLFPFFIFLNKKPTQLSRISGLWSRMKFWLVWLYYL